MTSLEVDGSCLFGHVAKVGIVDPAWRTSLDHTGSMFAQIGEYVSFVLEFG